MKLSWPAIAQAVTVALLLAVGAAVWQTYQQAQRIPTLEAKINEQGERLADLRVAIAVLDARSQASGRDGGRQFLPIAER